jgi:hypothetical protein
MIWAPRPSAHYARDAMRMGMHAARERVRSCAIPSPMGRARALATDALDGCSVGGTHYGTHDLRDVHDGAALW